MNKKNEWKRVSRKRFNKFVEEKDAHATMIWMPYLYYQSDGKDVARIEKGTFMRRYWIKEKDDKTEN